MTEKEQHMIFRSDTCMVNDNMICWIKERKHRRRRIMGKAENGEIREVTANIWTESIIYGSRLVLQNIQWGMEDYM